MSEPPPRRGFWEAPVPPAWALRALAKGIIGPERFEALVAYTADPATVRRRRTRMRSACSCRVHARRGCTSWRF
ncbi:MAG TPA: hypothetical protein VH498_02900 [Candidatus Dormibacteraeota bacterium]|jgi:hypothetical protein|nr:hypothetical protein [Candidatus Dormibacteraeota bacterium]